MSREQKRLAYESRLREIMARADTLDAQTMVALQDLTVDLQQRILGRLSMELTDGNAGRTWGAFWLPRLRRSVDEVLATVAQRAGPILGPAVADSWQIGSDLFELPTRAAYPELGVLSPAISLTTLTTVAPFSAELITAVTDTTRNVVDKAIRTNVVLGESPFELMTALSKSPLEKGPWKTLAYRTEIVTRTELSRIQTVSADARLQQAVLASPGLTQGPNGLKQIFTSVQIGPWPCEICAPLDGTVWDINDPNKPRPPMHPNCFPGFTKVRPLGKLEATFKRPYDGPIVELWVDGVEDTFLTVTPNHPVLTARGWVAAGEVDEGDDLIYCSLAGDKHVMPSLVKADMDDPEASFEQIHLALSARGFVEGVVDRPCHFHGDGGNEEVEIVWSDRLLRDQLEASGGELRGDEVLTLSDHDLAPLPGFSPASHCLGGVTACSESLTFLDAESCHSKGVGGRDVAPLDTVESQDSLDYRTVVSKSLADLEFGNAFGVHLDDLLLGDTGSTTTPTRKALLSLLDESVLGDVASEADLAITDQPGEGSQPNAGQVEFVDLLRVRRINHGTFTGHVFNLQSDVGFYLAAGIPVKNCRCMLSPFFPGISRIRTTPAPTADQQQRASVVESCGCCGGDPWTPIRSASLWTWSGYPWTS